MSSNATIYVGFWTNYSKGAVLGPTLTLSNRDGAILIGVLAVFIQIQNNVSSNSFESFETSTSWESYTKASAEASPSNSSLKMDSGLLDTQQDLAINSNKEDRIQLRRTGTCSPITTIGYSRNGTGGISFGNDRYEGYNMINFTAFFYGPSQLNWTEEAGISESILQNATYIYTSYRDVAGVFYDGNKSLYDLSCQAADVGSNSGSFFPMSALSVPNSTLTLVFVSFNGRFTQPSEDLWIPVYIPGRYSTFTIQNGSRTNEIPNSSGYITDNEISVMACLEQYQVCNPSKKAEVACTPLQTLSRLIQHKTGELSTVIKSDRQLLLAKTLLSLLAQSRLASLLSSFTSPLLLDSLEAGGSSLPPAPNQWILEMNNLFTIGLANFQHQLMEFVTGPPAQYALYLTPNQAANNSALKWLCSSQIIQRADYSNFCTLSIGLIFGVGVLITIISLCLDAVVGWVRLRYRSGRWRQRAWWTEGTLQLQRKAFEGMGIDDWEFGEVGIGCLLRRRERSLAR
ncbi:hypothetical protein G7Y89_g15548 [Cudoniella acicularis]|uniref:Uncharacterized protein n=1 Tax=Cudoniella acicularis TaxID=354080 RepID=A0A8H4VLV4_9HELO|nr:hypothetical protein G7Y89_g15548 [Cudoniella acicularis]